MLYLRNEKILCLNFFLLLLQYLNLLKQQISLFVDKDHIVPFLEIVVWMNRQALQDQLIFSRLLVLYNYAYLTTFYSSLNTNFSKVFHPLISIEFFLTFSSLRKEKRMLHARDPINTVRSLPADSLSLHHTLRWQSSSQFSCHDH